MAPSNENANDSPESSAAAPIRASYVWSLQEHRNSIAAVNAYQASARRLRMLLMYTVAVGLAFIGFQSIRDGRPATGAIWLIFAVVWIGFRSSTRWRTWLIRDPWRGKRIDWEFTEEGFTQKVEDLAEKQVSWADIRTAVVLADGILLFRTARMYYWIPTTSFDNQADFGRALGRIENKVSSIKRVN